MNDKALFARLIEKANEPGNMTRELGLTVTDITDGAAEGKICFVPESQNPRHLVHGGALFGVMDQMAGFAACTTGFGVVTINGSIDYLRSTVPGENLICKAEIVKAGRRFITVDARVWNEATGKLITKGSFAYCVMEELKKTIEDVCK